MESYPYTSVVTYDESGNPVYDRAVGAEFLRNFYKKDRSNGVIMLNDSTCFQVLSNNSMIVKVKPGYCFMQGVYGYESIATEVPIEPASATLSRIDTIVIRKDDNASVRGCTIDILKGTPSSNPQRPTLTRNDLIWEIGLADISIPAGTGKITAANINDTRYDANRCGVSIPLQEYDTTGLYKQMQAQIDENIELIKNALDGTMAGHLQNQLDTINARHNKLFAIGRIWITLSDDDPNDFLDGTWEKVDRCFLFSSGSDYEAGDTGGEFKHTLSIEEMPRHTHTPPIAVHHNGDAGQDRRMFATNWGIWGFDQYNNVTKTGNNQPHNNMPPYLVVNVWRRIA